MTATAESLADVDWGALPPEHLPRDVAELVDGWIANYLVGGNRDNRHFWAWEAANHLAHAYPREALAFVLAVVERQLSDEVRFSMAAGPLEDLLAHNGPTVIDEIERLARERPLFRETLRGVWKNAMTEEVWHRVVAARGSESSP
jgi:hypothetical protein